jgi:cytochrome c553
VDFIPSFLQSPDNPETKVVDVPGGVYENYNSHTDDLPYRILKPGFYAILSKNTLILPNQHQIRNKMDIGMRHLHVTVVLILLVFMLFKTILLLINKTDLLDRIRAKTKVADMVLGVLVLATGIYLVTLKPAIETYLWLKIILVIVAIPIGIVGLKRHKKLLAVLSVILIVYVYGIGETQSYKFKRSPVVLSNSEQPGQEIYKMLCVECHGSDGKKGLYKAPDLTASALSNEEMRERVLQGKGIMRGYANELNEMQVNAVLEYVSTLP